MLAINESLKGLQYATNKVDVASRNIANMANEDATAFEITDNVNIQNTNQPIDAVKEIVDLMQGETAYKANAKVIKSNEDMMGSILNIKA